MDMWSFFVEFKDGSFCSSNGLSCMQILEEIDEFVNEKENEVKDSHLAIKISIERE